MSRSKQIALYLVATILLLALTGAILRMKLEPLVHDFLVDSVSKSTNGAYSLEITNLNIRLLAGGFSLADVRISSDSTLIQIGKIDVGRIHVIRYIRDKTLVIGSVRIDTPTINFVPSKSIPSSASDSTSRTIVDRLYDAVKPVLTGVEIREIEIKEAEITIRNQIDGYEVFIAKDMEVRIRDVVIDSMRRPIDDIRIAIASFAWNLPNPLYRIQSNGISISTEDKRMSVIDFKLVPLADYESFAMTHRKHNRYEFEFDRIEITDWDSHALFHEGTFWAGRLSMDNPVLEVAHDKRLPPKPFKDRKLMHLMLHDSPIPINVDSVSISKGTIRYRHRHPDHDVPAMLTFEPLDAELRYVGNLGVPNMTLHVETGVMGEGQLTVDARFDMQNFKGSHTLKGVFVDAGFASFNPVTENMVLVRARSGYLKRMEFEMELDDVASTGFVTIDYENLTVQMLGDGKRVRTFLANQFVINRDHTGKDSTPETISFTRIREKNIFHYWWMSLLSGVAKTLGLK